MNTEDIKELLPDFIESYLFFLADNLGPDTNIRIDNNHTTIHNQTELVGPFNYWHCLKWNLGKTAYKLFKASAGVTEEQINNLVNNLIFKEFRQRIEIKPTFERNKQIFLVYTEHETISIKELINRL